MIRRDLQTAFFGALAGVLLAGAPMASAQMYGIGFNGAAGPSTFYTINPATGVATPVGPVGFNRCGAMDVGPGNIVYAACETAAATPVLITINPTTGAGTQIGPTGMSGAIGDISFRSNGTLFAYDATNDPVHTLFTVNTATGAATVVGDTGVTVAPGNGMSFNLAGTLFHSATASAPDPELNTLSTTTGLATFVANITFPAGCPGPGTCRINAMDVDPVSGTMFGLLNSTTGGSGNRQLVTINTTTGAVTLIGATAPDLDAISFNVFVPVELQGFTVE